MAGLPSLIDVRRERFSNLGNEFLLGMLFGKWFKEFGDRDPRRLRIVPNRLTATDYLVEVLFNGFGYALVEVRMFLAKKVSRHNGCAQVTRHRIGSMSASKAAKALV